METLGNQITQKICHRFYCKFCDYGTSKKSSFDNHKLSANHKKTTNGNVLETFGNQIMPELCPVNYSCQKCEKEFKNRSGLWKHKQKCTFLKKNDDSQESTKGTDLVLMLINDNKELRNLLIEQCKEKDEYKNMVMEVLKNGTHNTTHTNSHNKAFNLNFFLNETCKDAMNIMDFVDSIKLQLSDLERVGEFGFVDGISNIIVQNLKALDVSERPIHCTDKKREVIYVKDENKWEKDEEKTKMKKAIKRVANKNIRLLPAFKEKYPDCIKSTSNHSDQYNKMIIESMDTDGDNENKIISKISKEVIVQKETKLHL